MNDRADLCLAAEFDGVHVGQDDLSPEAVRKIIGPTAGSGYQLTTLNSCRSGSRPPRTTSPSARVFTTSSKANPDPVVGLEGVRRARALTRKPLVAIGGITRANARFRHRGRSGFRRGDIRFVTGSSQISRGIFPHLGVKLIQLSAFADRRERAFAHLADAGRV